MTYVVHGATGAQGGPVAAVLAAAGESVTAFTRRPDAVVAGARTLAVDLGSAAQLTEAYRGAKGVFVHLPVTGPELRKQYADNILTALTQARPERVVYSTSGVPATFDQMVPALAATGLPHAVIAPRFYLENLLLPSVQAGIENEGVLWYPLPDGFKVSWSSHLDIADAVAALFTRPDITGIVEVGQLPGITGADLAAAFAATYGRDVAFAAQTPADFGAQLVSLAGEEAAAEVQDRYEQVAKLPDNTIAQDRSAQHLLGLTPRSTTQWLTDLGLART
jgi:uncharacterized protein YbjT (DUF2867 family)